MKTIIKIHGKAGKKFTKKLEFFNIRKAGDAIKAINTRYPNFFKYLKKNADEGMHYEIIVNGEKEDGALEKKQEIKTIDIVPCVLGHGPLAFFVLAFVIGAVAIFGGFGVVATAFLFTLAVGLIIAGIMYLLTPIPENEPNTDIASSVKNSSFIFSNPSNISTQGRAIPVGYGRLRVGSYVVGTTITTVDLSQDRQNAAYENTRGDALVKIQESFGSSISNYFRGY